jgi:deoxyribodipyrimidine photolyase-related protein
MNIWFIFPTQLYQLSLVPLQNIDKIYIIEEPRYFTDFNFHKLKLVYHRATMKKYYDMLRKKVGNIVHYVEYDKVDTFYESVCESQDKNNTISTFYPEDHKLQKKLELFYKSRDKKITFYDSPNFLIKRSELEDIKKSIYKNSRYSHEEFYKYMRRKLDILIDSNNKPVGGKWSYDTENRHALPDDIKIPAVTKTRINRYIVEAKKYVEKHFSSNYGDMDNAIYPIDSKSTKKWLDKFLKERLNNFGPYEDAVINSDEPFLFHSVLSPMMNIGLITDMMVVTISYEYYMKHKKTGVAISIQSFEGFIRQVIGWRNYVYTLYLLEGETMHTMNQLNHTNKINKSMYRKLWEGETGITPIDMIIKKIVKWAYAHHIERLMYLGNMLLLCMIRPTDVYRMFMEWTIDSYDWVMCANVFGMSQFATPIMMTRPYFASSNYIVRMSGYKKDKIWDATFDSLYYNFISTHYKLLKSNYATAMQAKHWHEKSDSAKKEIKSIASNYIEKLNK